MAGVGFRFRPTDVFLIGVLEQKRKNPKYNVLKTTNIAGDLSEIYMYGPGKEPWELFSGAHEITELSETSDAQQKIREKYVVTQLNRIGKNCSRVAGNGCWLDKSKKRPVYYRGQQVGHWRTLTYEYSGDDGAADGKRYYYMNELHLSKPCDFVICRVLKNLSKDCQIKVCTKRRRQDEDQDFQSATKRSRRCDEESQASSSCSEIDQEQVDDDQEEQVDDDPQEYYNEMIDFSDPDIFGCIPDMLGVGENQVADLLGVSDIPSDPDFFGWVSDMLGQNQEHQVVDCPEMNMNHEVYVPDMSGVGQEQEAAEFWNFPEMPANCAPAMPDQGFFGDQWMEDLMKSVETKTC